MVETPKLKVGDVAWARVRIDTDPKDGACYCTPVVCAEDAGRLGEFNEGAQFFGVVAASASDPCAPPIERGEFEPGQWTASDLRAIENDLAGALQIIASLRDRVAALKAAPGALQPMSQAILDVVAESRRAEAREAEALPLASAAYAAAAGEQLRGWDGPMCPPSWWPWPDAEWKPSDVRGNLVLASALALAQLERHDVAAGRPGSATV